MGQGANQVSRDEPIRLREGESVTIRPDEAVTARQSYDTVDERTAGRAVPSGVAFGGGRDNDGPSSQMPDDPDAIEAEIERTRSEMSGTIDAIQQRLNPENLKQEAKDTANDLADQAKQAAREAVQHAVEEAKIHAREAIQDARHAVRGATIGKVEQMARTVSDTTQDTGNGIVETIKQNPIPAALTGIGLAWLLMNRQSAPARPQRRAYYEDRSYGESRVYRGNDYDRYDRDRFEGERYGAGYGASYGSSYGSSPAMQGGTTNYRQGQGQDESQGIVGRAQEKVGQAGDTLGNAAGQVGDTLGNAASQVGERVGSMAGQVGQTTSSLVGQAQEATGNLVDQATHRARYVEDRVGRAMQTTPLAVGAVALALGAAVGLAVPETRKEHELFGAARDNLMEQAQGFAQEAMEKVQGVASEAGHTVQREAKAQGITS